MTQQSRHQSSTSGLEELLDQIEDAAEEQQVTMAAVMDMVGRRSFGPLLLVAGLITLAPVIGDIPGVPTLVGLFVFLIAGQLLIGQDHFWLPRWMLRHSIARDTLEKILKWSRPPVRFIDRFLKSRLPLLVQGVARYVIAIICLGIALCMPIMEVVPFSANAAGVVLLAFGLALIADDGIVALLAYMLMATTYGVIFLNVL